MLLRIKAPTLVMGPCWFRWGVGKVSVFGTLVAALCEMKQFRSFSMYFFFVVPIACFRN